MSATVIRAVWGKIRTAKVIAYDWKRECGVAVDIDSNKEIYFETRSCRKVSADDSGNPRIQRAAFKHSPRVGNEILYILDRRPPSFKGEKPRAFVWAYLHFYHRSLQDQNGAMELEGALDGNFPPAAPAEPARNGKNHRPAVVTETAPALTVLPQATPLASTRTSVHEWSPGTSGPSGAESAVESGEEVPSDQSPEELVMAAGGCNRGKKPKPGQSGWTDGRRNGRGHRQDRRWRH